MDQIVISTAAQQMHLWTRDFSLVSDSEAPDFICRRPNGEVLGVEHTRILYNPERDEIRQYLGTYDPDSDNFDVLWHSAVAIAEKEAKRRKPH